MIVIEPVWVCYFDRTTYELLSSRACPGNASLTLPPQG